MAHNHARKRLALSLRMNRGGLAGESRTQTRPPFDLRSVFSAFFVLDQYRRNNSSD